jgi:hypothetical protein
MVAAFREIWDDFGVDEGAPLGKAKIIVPFRKGANIVALVGAPDVTPVVDKHKNVKFTEFKKTELSAKVKDLLHKPPGEARVLDGDARYFLVTGPDKGGGSDGTVVKAGSAELRAMVLEQRIVKVAIRHVEVPGPGGKPVNHSKLPLETDILLAQMNAIWLPQANVLFSLVPSAPIFVDKAKVAEALGKDQSYELPENVDISRFRNLFANNVQAGADLTFFLLRKVSQSDPKTTSYRGDLDRVVGVTSRENKFALISDNRSKSTMAHEAGHFRGSGHTESRDEKLLMRDGGAGTKLPWEAARDLNGKY